MARAGLTDPAFRPVGAAELMIYPSADGYRLAYKVACAKFDSRIVTFVDAKTGAVLFRFEELQTSSTVGTGTGTLGDIKKMSTDFESNTYYAIDLMRPAHDHHGRHRHRRERDHLLRHGRRQQLDSDGTVVDGHTYMGWTYDYYYHGPQPEEPERQQS